MGKFKRAFRKLPDPRAANAQHPLLEILVIALAATLCGAQSASEMALFGRSKEALLRQFLPLVHGIPSHDTFSRVFRLLNPSAFEHHFRVFMAAFAKQLTGVVAVDGKAMRRAYERGGAATPIQMVNVFATQTRMALASRKAPGPNEARGAVEVLDLLCLQGCIVTADALHCNRPFAAKVLQRGADYALALKENQGKLYQAVAACFARSGPRRTSAKQLEPKTHDRREARQATVIRNTSLAAAQKFPGIVAIGRITSRRRQLGGKADPVAVRYFLLSRYLTPKQLLQTVRSHWGIGNHLHWMLDVNFNEDGCRARMDNAPENLAILHRLAINIIRNHPDPISMRQKIKRAAWEDGYLEAILTHMQ